MTLYTVYWQWIYLFTDINECDNNPCQNGGQCTNSEGSFTCSCTDGWEGQVCDQSNLNISDTSLLFTFRWFVDIIMMKCSNKIVEVGLYLKWIISTFSRNVKWKLELDK